MQRSLIALSSLVSLTTLCAQNVAYDSSIVAVFANIGTSEGLWIVNGAGVCSPVTGLTAAGSAGFGYNSVRMDPIDSRVWLGGINSNGNTAGQINYVFLDPTATTVAVFQQHATTGGTGSIPAIEFDDNANPIVCSGPGLFRVSRKNGGVATAITAAPGGTNNAIAKDHSNGDMYVGVFTGAGIYRLTKNPDCSFQVPVLIATSPVTSVSGVTIVPGAPDEVWISTFGVAGQTFWRVPKTGGVPTAIANTLASSNWVEYDRRDNNILAIGAGVDPDYVQVMDTTGANTLVCSLQGGSVGSPATIDTNDNPNYNVVVAPMCLNGGLGPFDLELGVTIPPPSVNPFTVAGIFEATTNQVIAVGFVGADGRLSVNLPNITLGSPLSPGALIFGGACFDLSNGNLTLGALVNWPAN